MFVTKAGKQVTFHREVPTGRCHSLNVLGLLIIRSSMLLGE